MRGLTDVLASYGRFHRDPRNRLTHCFGVPAIVYSILVPAALYAVPILGVRTGLDRVLVAAAALAYLLLDLWFGLALAVAFALLAGAAEATATIGAAAGAWTAWTVAGAVFALGWALQLLGHRLEGNRPALLTNLAQIFVAPLFLVAELGFALGLRTALHAAVQERSSRGV
jgi:uncharacterized membrane protein YGL010W